MSRVSFRLAAMLAIAWGWPHYALAHAVTTGWEVEERARTAEIRAHRVEELAIVVEKGPDLAQAQAETAKCKTKAKARRKVRRQAPTETKIGEETKRRLYELQLLEALRSAGQR